MWKPLPDVLEMAPFLPWSYENIFSWPSDSAPSAFPGVHRLCWSPQFKFIISLKMNAERKHN